jgi:hypothetical protein
LCALFVDTKKAARNQGSKAKSTTPRAEQPPRTVRSHLNQSQGWGVYPHLWPQKSKPSERGRPYIHLHRQNRHRSAYETGREGHVLWALQPTTEPEASKAARGFVSIFTFVYPFLGREAHTAGSDFLTGWGYLSSFHRRGGEN